MHLLPEDTNTLDSASVYARPQNEGSLRDGTFHEIYLCAFVALEMEMNKLPRKSSVCLLVHQDRDLHARELDMWMVKENTPCWGHKETFQLSPQANHRSSSHCPRAFMWKETFNLCCLWPGNFPEFPYIFSPLINAF